MDVYGQSYVTEPIIHIKFTSYISGQVVQEGKNLKGTLSKEYCIYYSKLYPAKIVITS